MSYYVWRVVQIIHWSGAIIFEIRFNFASKHYLAYHLNIIWGWADFSWVLIFVSVTLLLLSPTSLVYHFRLPNWKPEMFTLVPCYEWPLNYSFIPHTLEITQCSSAALCPLLISDIFMPLMLSATSNIGLLTDKFNGQLLWGKIPSPMSTSPPFCADLDTWMLTALVALQSFLQNSYLFSVGKVGLFQASLLKMEAL